MAMESELPRILVLGAARDLNRGKVLSIYCVFYRPVSFLEVITLWPMPCGEALIARRGTSFSFPLLLLSFTRDVDVQSQKKNHVESLELRINNCTGL